jgi:hypothetical protein
MIEQDNNVIPFRRPTDRRHIKDPGSEAGNLNHHSPFPAWVLVTRWLLLTFSVVLWCGPVVAWQLGGLWGLLVFVMAGSLLALALVIASLGRNF